MVYLLTVKSMLEVLKLVMRSLVILIILIVFIEFRNNFQAASFSSNVIHGFILLMFVFSSFPLDVTNSSLLALSSLVLFNSLSIYFQKCNGNGF